MISEADQRRIAYAQTLLDSARFAKPTRFNSPEFLRCAVKHGLLKGSASLEEAYEVFGKLLTIETLRIKRLKLGMVAAIESLTPAEILSLRESFSGVVPFRSSKSNKS